MVDKLYKFYNRKTKELFGYSRHEFPDFCYMYKTKEERDKYWLVEEVIDKKEIDRNTW